MTAHLAGIPTPTNKERTVNPTHRSFKPEVCASRDGSFSQNALCFASREEAEDSAKDLYQRWTLCTDHRAVESSDPVTHALVDGVLESVGAEHVKA